MRITGLTVILCLAISLLSPGIAEGQPVRQIALNTGDGTVPRLLPAQDSFDFVLRATNELLRVSARVQPALAQGDTWTELDPWIRVPGTRAGTASIRVHGLEPGTSYRFEFVLVRRPTGNEARLIEASLVHLLREAATQADTAPIGAIARIATEGYLGSLGDILGSHDPVRTTESRVEQALTDRGLEALQAQIRDRARTLPGALAAVEAARHEVVTARLWQARIPLARRRIVDATRYPELAAPLAACEAVATLDVPRAPDGTEDDLAAALAAVRRLDQAVGNCRGLLRDLRLRQYEGVGVDSTGVVSGLMAPLADAIAVARTELDGLLRLVRRRSATMGQVAGDLRRALDTGVEIDTVVTTTLATERRALSTTALGLGLAATRVPCSTSGHCVRVAPYATVRIGLGGWARERVAAEAGLTLASLAVDQRSDNLFWFTGLMLGVTFKPFPARGQRLSAGALVLRNAEPGRGNPRVHGYIGLTLFELRL